MSRTPTEMVLRFPDGRLVGPGDLDEWLTTIEAEEDIPEEGKAVARGIVQQIRALSN